MRGLEDSLAEVGTDLGNLKPRETILAYNLFKMEDQRDHIQKHLEQNSHSLDSLKLCLCLLLNDREEGEDFKRSLPMTVQEL